MAIFWKIQGHWSSISLLITYSEKRYRRRQDSLQCETLLVSIFRKAHLASNDPLKAGCVLALKKYHERTQSDQIAKQHRCRITGLKRGSHCQITLLADI